MKKFLALTMAGIMLFTSTAFAQQTNIFYNGDDIEYTDQIPVIINDRTYVPIRDVFEEMGFLVDWDDDSRVVTLGNDYYYAFINTNNNILLSVDKALEMKCFKLSDEIQLINGRTMLPLREILETMNYEIQWEANTKSSIIEDKNDYAYLDEEYDKYESLYLDDEYEIDETKEIGSFTEEEIAYLKTVTEVLEDLSETVSNDDENIDADELSAELTNRVQVLLDTPCPESLGSFGDDLTKGLKASGLHIYGIYKNMELFTDGLDDKDCFEVAFGLYMIMLTKCIYELKPALDDIKNICIERNIPQEYLQEIVAGDTEDFEIIEDTEDIVDDEIILD